MVFDSLDKYAGIVTSKYPFTRVNSLRIKQATAVRSITSSLLLRMVQLIVSQSPCSEAAKMFKKSAIFKHNKVSPSSTWPRILGSGRTRSIRPGKIPKIWTGDFCWMESAQVFLVFSWRHKLMQIRFPPCWCPCQVWNFMQIYAITKCSQSKSSNNLSFLTNEYFPRKRPKITRWDTSAFILW